jgi:hypothetical protein
MINGTMVLQVVHFICAYYILKKIFFQPAINLVQKRRNHLRLIRHDISQEHAAVEELRQYKAEQWRSCRQTLNYMKPDFPEQASSFQDHVRVNVEAALSQSERTAAVDELAETIMQKVVHD